MRCVSGRSAKVDPGLAHLAHPLPLLIYRKVVYVERPPPHTTQLPAESVSAAHPQVRRQEEFGPRRVQGVQAALDRRRPPPIGLKHSAIALSVQSEPVDPLHTLGRRGVQGCARCANPTPSNRPSPEQRADDATFPNHVFHQVLPDGEHSVYSVTLSSFWVSISPQIGCPSLRDFSK